VPAVTGTAPHRAGYRGGSNSRNRAANRTAEADANNEALENRWPGHVFELFTIMNSRA
jgi:hypothetical protein